MPDDVVRNDANPENVRVFGLLTVMGPTGELIRGVKVYECRCACGNVDKATIPLLMMGRKTSCGCQNRSKTAASKPDLHEVERLRTLVAEDGRSLEEIAEAANLPESLLNDGLAGKRRLSLANTCSLLKAMSKHWSDLDDPTFPSTPTAHPGEENASSGPHLDLSNYRNPLPRADLMILPPPSRSAPLNGLLSRNRFESAKWPIERRRSMTPYTEGESQTPGDSAV